MSLVELNSLSLGYNKHTVIKNLSLSIDEHDFICIVGPNGSGKTTLVRGILGLLKPHHGSIKFSDGLTQNFIGYMPQESTIDPNFPASVFEIVLSGTLNHQTSLLPFYKQSAKNTALNSLRMLHIEKLKDSSFADLSGGQKQKVLLARALAATTKLLILDEPSNNLDYKSKKELYGLVKDLHNKQNIAIIMVTHDLDHDNLLGNKILSLQEKDIFFGSTKEFIRKVHHE